MGKKKKGGRRLSSSDFAGDDAMLQEILTGSSSKSGRVPNDKGERALAFPPKPAPVVAAATATLEPPSASKASEEASTSLASINDPESGSVADIIGPSQSSSVGERRCQHVKTAVKVSKLTKDIAHQNKWDHCQGCQPAESKAKKQAHQVDVSLSSMSLSEPEKSVVGPLPSESLWMCLTCIEINCGRQFKKHALSHHEGKKGNHPLAINLGSMECWCYGCDSQVVPSKNKNQVIHECQVIIEKTLQIKQSKMRSASAASAATSKKSKGETIITAPLPKAKVFAPGLQNLGNTCFFNSVVQVLTETKSLRSILSEDGGTSSGSPKSLAAGTDAGLGPLTTAFKIFLFNMWKQKGGTIAPRDLFTQIARKWKVFRGFRQQDSQELMRYLFDGIKHEELDMIKRHFSEEERSQKEETEEAKEGESTGSVEKKEPQFVPFIDSCFSGKLVSVIVCDACKKCSYAPEDFFDLSLPVRGPTQTGAAAGSSHKARLVAQSKRATAVIEAESKADDTPADESDPLPESDRPSEAHLRHVEKLLKSIGPSTSNDLSIQRSLKQFTSVDRLDGENKFACENCFKLIQRAKEKDGEIVEQDVITEASKEKEGVTVEQSIESEASEERKDESVEQNIESDVSREKEEDSVEQDVESETSKESEEAIQNKDTESEQVQEEETVAAAVSDPELVESESDEDDEESGEEQTDILGNTIPKKAKKVAEPKKPAEAPKFIFRKAFKRYLISDLPPTLVLHLKRFESSGRFGQMRKIEDHVDIPVELDMTPYFVPKNEIEEEDEKENASETKGEVTESKKYRLYGAVVHMGTLGGGHYINYVLSSKVELADVAKAAVQVKEKAKSKSTAGVNGQELPDVPVATQQEEKAEEKEKDQAGNKDASSSSTATEESTQPEDKTTVVAVQEEDKRQWIACSDSSVRLSSLEEVLASRAYLLFYERC
ncbi:Ubiquitin carboxyl-terminal hydrolase 16 [Linnemannia zychae]|nr:Ubiquitin carboxyl-terminal hydrolase 16 [Linnemannia zychae]